MTVNLSLRIIEHDTAYSLRPKWQNIRKRKQGYLHVLLARLIDQPDNPLSGSVRSRDYCVEAMVIGTFASELYITAKTDLLCRKEGVYFFVKERDYVFARQDKHISNSQYCLQKVVLFPTDIALGSSHKQLPIFKRDSEAT